MFSSTFPNIGSVLLTALLMSLASTSKILIFPKSVSIAWLISLLWVDYSYYFACVLFFFSQLEPDLVHSTLFNAEHLIFF